VWRHRESKDAIAGREDARQRETTTLRQVLAERTREVEELRSSVDRLTLRGGPAAGAGVGAGAARAALAGGASVSMRVLPTAAPAAPGPQRTASAERAAPLAPLASPRVLGHAAASPPASSRARAASPPASSRARAASPPASGNGANDKAHVGVIVQRAGDGSVVVRTKPCRWGRRPPSPAAPCCGG
jgi:hypothetical protein